MIGSSISVAALTLLGPVERLGVSRRKDEKTVDGPEAPGANFDLVPRCRGGR